MRDEDASTEQMLAAAITEVEPEEGTATIYAPKIRAHDEFSPLRDDDGTGVA
jgi:hypothetical protein